MADPIQQIEKREPGAGGPGAKEPNFSGQLFAGVEKLKAWFARTLDSRKKTIDKIKSGGVEEQGPLNEELKQLESEADAIMQRIEAAEAAAEGFKASSEFELPISRKLESLAGRMRGGSEAEDDQESRVGGRTRREFSVAAGIAAAAIATVGFAGEVDAKVKRKKKMVKRGETTVVIKRRGEKVKTKEAKENKEKLPEFDPIIGRPYLNRHIKDYDPGREIGRTIDILSSGKKYDLWWKGDGTEENPGFTEDQKIQYNNLREALRIQFEIIGKDGEGLKSMLQSEGVKLEDPKTDLKIKKLVKRMYQAIEAFKHGTLHRESLDNIESEVRSYMFDVRDYEPSADESNVPRLEKGKLKKHFVGEIFAHNQRYGVIKHFSDHIMRDRIAHYEKLHRDFNKKEAKKLLKAAEEEARKKKKEKEK